MKKAMKKIIALALATSIPMATFPSMGLTAMAQTSDPVVADSSIATETVLTHDFEIRVDEPNANLLEEFVSETGGKMSISEEVEEINHTVGGAYSMKLEGDFDVSLTSVDMNEGKKISFWLYDDLAENKEIIMQLSGAEDKNSKAYEMYIGIENNKYTAYSKTSTETVFDGEKVDRTNAWHQFTIDMTVEGQVSFVVDETKLGTIDISEDFAEYQTFSFIRNDEVTDKAIYIDDIDITTKAPVVDNLIIDDKKDTFSWNFVDGKVNPADYEYSLDGGSTYVDCLDVPVYVGNKNYAVGDIAVRVKSQTSSYDFPSTFNKTAFTETDNVYGVMEETKDLDLFKNPKTSLVSEFINLGTKYSHSGLTSMVLKPVGTNTYEITHDYGHDELVKNKVVSIWYYDELDKTDGYNAQIYLAHMSNDSKYPKVHDKDVVSSIFLGVQTGANRTNYYVYRTNWGATYNSSVVRSKGWHCYQWDYTSGDKCDVYIDGVKITSFASEGFTKFSFTDYWSTKQHTLYYDDFTITDTREEVEQYPVAPTSPKVDDANDTFDFTYVSGKTDVNLYEYSYDNGKTFQNVTEKPIKVPAITMLAGTVMVRLKATDSTNAGMVLRSTANFTDPIYGVIKKGEDLVDFCKYANVADYTEESFANLQIAIENFEKAVEANQNIQNCYDALVEAKNNMEYAYEGEKIYTFEDKITPVTPITGTPDWGDRTNLSTLTTQSFKTNTVNGVAEVQYNFLEKLDDNQVIFYFWDYQSVLFEITMGDSESGIAHSISSMYESGSKSYRYLTYDFKNGTRSNRRDTSIARRQDLRKIEINTASDTGTQIYMDDLLILSDPNMSSLDYLNFYAKGNGYMSFDELTIRDKNAVTEINYPVESVDLGYYDTYEMNVVNYELEKPYDYDTTDKFTYTIADPSVAYITKGGSIQPVAKEGTTTATITSINGVSKTIQVNVHDYKVEGVQLSDAVVTGEPNYITELSMQPDEIEVVNAILTPANVTNRNKTWTSSNPEVATVIDGQIKSHKEGTAVITVKTEDGGHEASITVTVATKEIDYAIELFVAEDGDDMTGDGSIENPFASIARARDEARTCSQIIEGGLLISVRAGKYVISDTIALEMQDSGNEESPVTYSAYNGEEVILTGSFSVAPSDFSLVSDPTEVDKLQDNVVGQVYVADVSKFLGNDRLSPLAIGYTDNTDYLRVSVESTEQSAMLEADGINTYIPYYNVSFNSEAMTLSRWPNVGDQISGSVYPSYSKINSITYKGATIRNWHDDQYYLSNYVWPEDRDIYDSFRFKSNTLTERMKTWDGIALDDSNILDEKIWFEGYIGASFASQTAPIRSIAADGGVKSHIAGAYAATSGDFSRIYVYNLLQELDIPGEWYIDTDTGMMYLIPPEGSDMSSDEEIISVATLPTAMFKLTDAKNITVQNMTITDTLGAAAQIYGGSDNTISRCTIQNISSRIGLIINSENEIGMRNGFEYCTIKDVNGGITTMGYENYADLTPSHHFIKGCLFDNYQTLMSGFNPAIVMHGVGNIASSNEICHSPNNAIMWQGNDHTIEFNDIHDVVTQTTDTSAIYTGRNVIHRGTVVKNNYIHNIGKYGDQTSSNIGIYLDDLSSEISIYDNVLDDLTWAVFINGGQANQIYDNKITNCKYGIIATDWAYMGLFRWYFHGYGLIKEGTSLIPNEVDWEDDTGVYSKYKYLHTTMADAHEKSIYNKVINNDYTGTTNLFEYRARSAQPDTTNVLKDWFFDKDNYQN